MNQTPSQITIDSRAYDNLLQSLENTNARLRKVEAQLDAQKEKTRAAKAELETNNQGEKEMQAKLKQIKKDQAKLIKKIYSEVEVMEKITNGLFRDIVRNYPTQNVTYRKRHVSIILLPEFEPTCNIDITLAPTNKDGSTSNTFLVSTHLGNDCLHLPSYNFPCEGKPLQTMAEVYGLVNELIAHITEHVTKEEHAKLVAEQKERRGQLNDLVSRLSQVFAGNAGSVQVALNSLFGNMTPPRNEPSQQA